MLFSKGAFFIPFSGDKFKDAILISIIYDYNQTHELNINNQIKNEAYILLERINAEFDKLIEPKIVQHFGKSVRYGWPTYLQIAESGGFYNYDFLLDNETYQNLNNDYFNIFIWPYLPDSTTIFEQAKTLLNINETNTIRKFVNNGGGFIGTCYGAYTASSGFIIPGVFNSLRFAYYPNLLKIMPGFSLSISDSLMTVKFRFPQKLIQVTHKILKPDHQLFYSINRTIPDFFKSPIFVWTGKNTEILTVYDSVKTFLGEPINDSYIEHTLVGRPSFINSKFGTGEVLIFSSHPDYVNNISLLFSKDIKWDGDRYYGRRIIFNSFFYVTSMKNTTPDFAFNSNVTFINLVINKTKHLQINNVSNNRFNEIFADMDKIVIKLTDLNTTLIRIIDFFDTFLEKSKLFPDSYRFFNYSSLLTDVFKNYINNTHSSLNKLDKIIPMISLYNSSISFYIEKFKTNIKNQLNKAIVLLDYVNLIAQKKIF